MESPWEDEAVEASHTRNLRVSFTWMPAPSVYGWPEQLERQRAILEQAAAHFDAGELRVQVGATFAWSRRRKPTAPWRRARSPARPCS